MDKPKREFRYCSNPDCGRFRGVFKKDVKVNRCFQCGVKLVSTYTDRRELYKIFDGFYKINKPVKAVYLEIKRHYYCRIVIVLENILFESKDDLKGYGLPDRIQIVRSGNISILNYYFTVEECENKRIFRKNYKKATKDIYRFTKNAYKTGKQ